jgi:hypothetical protein
VGGHCEKCPFDFLGQSLRFERAGGDERQQTPLIG